MPGNGAFGPGRGPLLPPVSPVDLGDVDMLNAPIQGAYGPGRGPMPRPVEPIDLGDVDMWNAPVQGSYGPGRGPMPPGIENFRAPPPVPGINQFMSDERAKSKIAPMEDPTLATRAYWRPVVDAATAQPVQYSMSAPPIRPGVDLRAAKGYSYDYKDPTAPGAEPGRQVGPMAQDLEHTAAAGAVKPGPDGMKHVDAGRLTMVNTAALAEQQKRTDRLEAMIAAMQKAQMPAPLPTQQFASPDYSALDDAYAQQQQDTQGRSIQPHVSEKPWNPTSAQLAHSGELPPQELLEGESPADDARSLERFYSDRVRRLGRATELAPVRTTADYPYRGTY